MSHGPPYYISAVRENSLGRIYTIDSGTDEVYVLDVEIPSDSFMRSAEGSALNAALVGLRLKRAPTVQRRKWLDLP